MRQVNLVNHIDEVIGQTDLLDAHRGDGKKHQAVSLFLFHQRVDGKFDLLLQQRSSQKILGKRQWANTLCANLSPGEKHETCLRKRFREELGASWQDDLSLTEVAVINYQVACEHNYAENEIDHIFVTVLNDQEFTQLKLVPTSAEVADLAWLDWEAVKNKELGQRVTAPWFNLFLENQSLIKKIDKVLKV